MLSDQEILALLPHEKPRPGQLELIKRILKSFESGKRFVFVEAPVGSGKSAVGLTIAGCFKSSFYLTIQKILQSQLTRDYSTVGLVDLKGRSNYPCTYYDVFGDAIVSAGKMKPERLQQVREKGLQCNDGYCRRQLNKSKCKSCFPPENTDDIDRQQWLSKHGVVFSTCPYYERVAQAMMAPKVLMNFSSFLYQTCYAPFRFKKRELLIIDEGHHCEGQLMSFITLTLSDREFAGLTLPDFENSAEYAIWLIENDIQKKLNDMAAEARENGNFKRGDELAQVIAGVARFLNCVDKGELDWVHEYSTHGTVDTGLYHTVELKPIFVRSFSHLLFDYGEKILIMSATILDQQIMADSLGIKPGEYDFIRVGSSFPVSRRPIYVKPAYKATGGKAKQHEWMPAMIKAVDVVVEKYAGKRGIIHTHNFSITKALLEKCKTKHRFLSQNDFDDKEAMLVAHGKRSDSVIVAPAMHEGLDLIDDLSRFQIIVKTPFPNFYDDKQLKARVDDNHNYLTWLTALKVVQSYGRSIRSAKDWADTYIFDETMIRFLHEADRMLPKWFKEAVKVFK